MRRFGKKAGSQKHDEKSTKSTPHSLKKRSGPLRRMATKATGSSSTTTQTASSTNSQSRTTSGQALDSQRPSIPAAQAAQATANSARSTPAAQPSRSSQNPKASGSDRTASSAKNTPTKSKKAAGPKDPLKAFFAYNNSTGESMDTQLKQHEAKLQRASKDDLDRFQVERDFSFQEIASMKPVQLDTRDPSRREQRIPGATSSTDALMQMMSPELRATLSSAPSDSRKQNPQGDNSPQTQSDRQQSQSMKSTTPQHSRDKKIVLDHTRSKPKKTSSRASTEAHSVGMKELHHHAVEHIPTAHHTSTTKNKDGRAATAKETGRSAPAAATTTKSATAAAKSTMTSKSSSSTRASAAKKAAASTTSGSMGKTSTTSTKKRGFATKSTNWMEQIDHIIINPDSGSDTILQQGVLMQNSRYNHIPYMQNTISAAPQLPTAIVGNHPSSLQDLTRAAEAQQQYGRNHQQNTQRHNTRSGQQEVQTQQQHQLTQNFQSNPYSKLHLEIPPETKSKPSRSAASARRMFSTLISLRMDTTVADFEPSPLAQQHEALLDSNGLKM